MLKTLSNNEIKCEIINRFYNCKWDSKKHSICSLICIMNSIDQRERLFINVINLLDYANIILKTVLKKFT